MHCEELIVYINTLLASSEKPPLHTVLRRDLMLYLRFKVALALAARIALFAAPDSRQPAYHTNDIERSACKDAYLFESRFRSAPKNLLEPEVPREKFGKCPIKVKNSFSL